MQICGMADPAHCRGVSSSKKCDKAKSIVKGGKFAAVADSIWGTGCIGLEVSWIPGRIDSEARGVLL
jgi:hypothetical protein